MNLGSGLAAPYEAHAREIGILYLYRFAEGEAPVRKFLKLLSGCAAGAPFDLHVIFKGFPNRQKLRNAFALFEGVAVNCIELDDTDFDIGAYLTGARLVTNQRLVFLNTFSEILADNWLFNFNKALSQPNVGLVGASGSWQARTTSYEVQLRLLLERFKVWRPNKSAPFEKPNNRPLIRRPRTPREVAKFALAPITYFYHLLHYPRYPNPHIRTNAFMVDRKLFLSLRFPSFRTKEDAYRFESGRQSITRQIVRKGLRAVVVDRYGRVYDINQWNDSFTFWQGGQENLLIADNRTRDYAEGSAHFRVLLENSAWRHPRDWKRL